MEQESGMGLFGSFWGSQGDGIPHNVQRCFLMENPEGDICISYPLPRGSKRCGGAPMSEPITFAGTPLGEYRHICAFFHTPDEMYRVLMPFIQEGFKRGDRGFHIVDTRNWEDHVNRLRKASIEADVAMERGQLEVRNWHQAYLRDGHFSQDRMLALIEEVLQEGPKQGYEITRLVAHMEWALEDMPGVDDLVEYETRLNYVLPRYKDPVI